MAPVLGKIYVAVLTAGEKQPRYRSMPPGPNSFSMSLKWREISEDESYNMDFSTNPKHAVKSAVKEFADKFGDNVDHEYTHPEYEGGVFESKISFGSDMMPSGFDDNVFYWQEPCYERIRGNNNAPNLKEATFLQCLERLPAMADYEEVD